MERKTTPPGPKAAKIIDIIKKHAYDSTFMYPLVIKGGHDCIIEDVDGNEYLDFTSNVGACPLGYSHPEILEILKQYSSNGAHKIAGQDFTVKSMQFYQKSWYQFFLMISRSFS